MANDIPNEIVQRIITQYNQKKNFHVYIVLPMFPEGNPISASISEVRSYEWRTIQYMVTSLHRVIGSKWTEYLSFYFLANWTKCTNWKLWGRREDRVRAHDRYMVYVHSKMMLIDDRHIILGSANLNERSLAGDRDSEVACWARPGPRHQKECTKMLREFRLNLWKEHFGPLPTLSDTPNSPKCVQSVRQLADTNYVHFRMMTSEPSGHICRWPFVVTSGAMSVKSTQFITGPDAEIFLPDAESTEEDWQWNAPGASFTRFLTRFSTRITTVAE